MTLSSPFIGPVSPAAASQPPTAIAAQCDDSMTWTYDASRGTLRDAMGQCLTRAAKMEDNRGVTLEPCGDAGQDGRQASGPTTPPY